MDAIKFTLTNESVFVIYEGKRYSVQASSPNFVPLKKALLEENWEEVPKHLTIGKSLESWAKGNFKVNGDNVSYKGENLPRDLNDRIVAMAAEGSDPTSLFKFWERLQKNPSMRSVEQLWRFLKHQNIPLTVEGKFLAYKGVRSDYKDQHTGTIDNSPGSVNRMPRNKISDDPREACHFGFHVGALDYARSFASQVVICEVDPEHVVCVPYDHSDQKMRICEYKVIGNYGGELPSTVAVADTEVDEFVETSEDDFEQDIDQEEVEEQEDDSDESSEEGMKEEEPKEGEDPFEVTHEDADKEQAKAAAAKKKEEKKEREKAKNSREKNPDKRAAKKGFGKFTKMGMDELIKQSIEDLRKYASNGLEIVGASKIPGGKTELIKRILKVRNGTNN